MDKSILSVTVLALAGAAGASLADPAPDAALPGPAYARQIALQHHELFVEWAPGHEAVVRFAAESDDELERVRIFHPDGRELVQLGARERVQGGLGSVELEFRAPDLESLRGRYAEGRYEIVACTVGGALARGSSQLSFDLPGAPALLHPSQGALVEVEGLTLSWSAERDVEGFEVQLEQGDDEGLRIKLPPQQTSLQVPAGFLARGSETHLEVAAIGANGNRTLTQVIFRTAP